MQVHVSKNFGPLQEEQVLSVNELSLQPPLKCKYLFAISIFL